MRFLALKPRSDKDTMSALVVFNRDAIPDAIIGEAWVDLFKKSLPLL